MTKDSSALRLELAPPGIARAGQGTFWIGLCLLIGWCVIVGAAHFINHAGSTKGGVYIPPNPLPLSAVPPWVWVIMGAFLIAGLAVTMWGVNMGVRRAIIEVADDALCVDQTDLLGNRCLRWTRGEIAGIGVAATGFSVGGSKKRGGVGRALGAPGMAIEALVIELASGRRIRLLAGRDVAELDGVAVKLRAALNCGECRINA